MRCFPTFSIVLTLLGSQTAAGQTSSVAAATGATFRSGVDLVTISAVVRDQKGRVVTDLTRADFELLDQGERRPITGFRAEQAAVSVALLFDVSGSMEVAAKIEAARRAASIFAATSMLPLTSNNRATLTAACSALKPVIGRRSPWSSSSKSARVRSVTTLPF